MIYVFIDEFTPCLRDSITLELVQTEAVAVVRKSFLSKFNPENHWYVKWDELSEDYEIYALVLKGTAGVQGLVALQKDEQSKAAFIAWMVAAPENNKLLVDKPRYYGVGGHLFAIAASKSIEWGYGGAMHGFAANEELLKHYQSAFGAEHIGALHPYQFYITPDDGAKITEEYDYEWTRASL